MTASNRATRFMLTALTVLLVSAPAFAQLKIGYIRPSFIFSQYEPYLEAQRKIEAYQETEMGKLEKQQQELQQSADDYTQKSLVMSEEMKQQRQQELMKQDELIAPIIDDINDVLLEIGETDEYDYIFDADAGGLIWADEQYDLSEAVLDELTKGLATQ